MKPEIHQLTENDKELQDYLWSVVKTIPTCDDPQKLEDFNYEFKNGKLLNKDSSKAFHWVNQTHYDALGDTIVNHIQDLLVTQYNLKEVILPLSGPIESIMSIETDHRSEIHNNDKEHKAEDQKNIEEEHQLETQITDKLNVLPLSGSIEPIMSTETDLKSEIQNNAETDLKSEIQNNDKKRKSEDTEEGHNPETQSTDKHKPTESKNRACSNIFVSPDVLTCSTLLLLIQGAGAVRAGQWARALCINEDLSIGTIFPYVDTARKMGWGVIVFNPNLNEVPIRKEVIKREWFLTTEKILRPKGETVKVKGSENYLRHGYYIWENIVRKSAASSVLVVAHSRGGDNIVQMINQFQDEFYSKVPGIAFTDSVHSVGYGDPDHVIEFLKKRCCNWVTSPLPLNSVVGNPKLDCIRVSAGHRQHEYTSGTAIKGVFGFLTEQLEKFLKE